MTDERTQAELEVEFRSQWNLAKGLARRSVDAAWEAGTILVEIKARLPHGEWMAWLTAEGLTESTSRRLRRLASLDREALVDFDTVGAALKSLPSPIPPPPPPPPPREPAPGTQGGGAPLGASSTAQAGGAAESAGPSLPAASDAAAPPLSDLPDAETAREIEHETTRQRLVEAEWKIDDLQERAALQGEGSEPTEHPHKALAERFNRLQVDYHTLKSAHEKAESKLTSIRRDLLEGKGTAEVLAVHFGAAAK